MYGPEFVRNSLFSLQSLDHTDKNTGWRETCSQRVEELTSIFLAGGFGISVTCGIQVLDTESSAGKKLLDDGVSTVKALLQCHAHFVLHPNSPNEDGEPWPSRLLDIFQNGLQCTVVKYTDNDDREEREAWNVQRHDQDTFTIRWSSLYQKLLVVLKRYRRCGDWQKTQSAIVGIYGPSKNRQLPGGSMRLKVLTQC
jgi:hypothetical protein